jgi:hypothetical protein
MRPPVHELAPMFFCDDCHRFGDVPIPDDPILRRVTVTLEAYVAATSLVPREAHRRAVDELLRMINGAGGVMNLVNVTSTIGQFRPEPPTRANGRAGVRV